MNFSNRITEEPSKTLSFNTQRMFEDDKHERDAIVSCVLKFFSLLHPINNIERKELVIKLLKNCMKEEIAERSSEHLTRIKKFYKKHLYTKYPWEEPNWNNHPLSSDIISKIKLENYKKHELKRHKTLQNINNISGDNR